MAEFCIVVSSFNCALTAYDAVDTLTNFSVNPVIFTISALFGSVIALACQNHFENILNPVTYGINVDDTLYATSTICGKDMSLTILGGFLPAILCKISSIARTVFFNGYIGGFRTGFVFTLTALHIKHVQTNNQNIQQFLQFARQSVFLQAMQAIGAQH